MKAADFRYDLPDELIARYPPEKRTDSRLLCLDRKNGDLSHRRFSEFPELISSGDLLVFNNTKVIPARLFGRKESGGRIEILLERFTGGNQAVAQLRAGKSPRAGSKIMLDDGGRQISVEVLGRDRDFFRLAFPDGIDVPELLEKIGHVPLPPYIGRDDESIDRERYQTVYGEVPGAVAAPTAGLHFDQAMLDQVRRKNIDTAFVTLHVGAGTFQPVRTEKIEDHRMHAEYLEVDETVCEKVSACRKRGGRVIAVGTTSVRCLETASGENGIEAYRGETDLFIYPGYQFKTVDALLTNFHLPESTLIMLVCAFAGTDSVLHAYREAVREKYRFFSYGDAMLIL